MLFLFFVTTDQYKKIFVIYSMVLNRNPDRANACNDFVLQPVRFFYYNIFRLIPFYADRETKSA